MLDENKYADMDDYDNSSLFIVRIIDGKAYRYAFKNGLVIQDYRYKFLIELSDKKMS